MSVAKVYDVNGESKDTVELKDDIFNSAINKAVVYEVINAFIANQHQGTKATKGRSLVTGSGAKPYRQKGTGRARAGTRKSPIWRHGGHTFMLRPGKKRIRVSAQKKQIALKSALTSKYTDNDIYILADFSLPEPKTKKITDLLKNLDLSGKGILFVLPENTDIMYKSIRNIDKCQSVYVGDLNAFNVMKCNKIIFLKSTLGKLEERLLS